MVKEDISQQGMTEGTDWKRNNKSIHYSTFTEFRGFNKAVTCIMPDNYLIIIE